ncbi:MAG: flagellar basal-body rod protein FlgF [Alphaproteobacteria bacterium]
MTQESTHLREDRNAMENTTYIALSRQAALRTEMTVVSNNIANMNTTGFKASRMLFEEFVEGETQEDPVSMVSTRGTHVDWSPGAMVQTGGTFDMAIKGNAFFAVETAQGTQYTRNGAFQLSDGGELVDGNGNMVMDTGNQSITIPAGVTDMQVTRAGQVMVGGQPVGQLKLVSFDPTAEVKPIGGGMYSTDAAELEAPEGTVVAQGMLEQSNVNGIVEMTRMIELHRAYDRARNLINKEDERQKSAIGTLGKLA